MDTNKTDKEQFLKIIDTTPLVSIDLIIKNSRGEILLGKRVNRPAQGYWFVPGGRIFKNEKIEQAIKRISKNELGRVIELNDVQLLGAYDHIYDDNFLGKAGVNTHYVVLGYTCEVEEIFEVKPDDQHTEMKWWPLDELIESSEVHPNTKAYFG